MQKLLFLLLFLISSLSVFAQSKATQKLFRAIDKNDSVLASYLISSGADVNGVDDMKAPTTTVFIKAIELKRIEIVKLLISQNTDVNQRRPSDFKSGLMIATEMNNTEIVSALMNAGADVNLETLRGETALHIASKNNSVESAELLLNSREIDVNAGGENCALFAAAKSGNVGMTLLLKKQSGAKATSPVCIEKAREVTNKEEIVRVLGR